jgi:putative transposase
MKKSRYSEPQIVHVLQQAEAGIPVEELLRKYGISQATFYAWRKKFGGMSASEAQRLKQLEEENGRLKRVVADLTLDKQILQDVLAKKV